LIADDWYFGNGKFSPRSVLAAWNERLKSALERGYDGIRAHGTIAWMKREKWSDIVAYERHLHQLATANS
jgi:hypothetical protein